MLVVSYNLSSTLKERLDQVDDLRQEILLIPVSLQTESSLRWQSMLAHVEGWANLTNQSFTKTYINEIIDRLRTKTTSPQILKVQSYKNAINYVYETWSANSDQVTFKTIEDLAGILGVSPGSQKEVEPLLTYLQTGQLHPLIQSATAHLYFYPSRLAYLTSLLFLAKHGYALRGWLSLEDYWGQNKSDYQQVLSQATNSANTTLWLEFFSQGVIVQMAKLKNTLASAKVSKPPGQTRLTQRQLDILKLMDNPKLSVTNKQVQTAFKISQVTASRDLAKLVSSGLILPRYAGRSTSYSKA